MTREEFKELSAVYVAGGLAGEDLRQFEEYMRNADLADLEELREFKSVISLLPTTLERKEPAANVKTELMQKLRLSAHAENSAARRTITAKETQHPRQRWLYVGITVGALVMVVAFSLFVSNLVRTIEQQDVTVMEMRKENIDLNARLVALRDEVARKEELLNVLASKKVEITLMDGLKVNPVGYGKVIWDPEKRTAILQVSNLPPVSSDKDYQLWVLKGKLPISAGVFAVSNSDPNFFRIENLAFTNPREISAFAITLEPKGGVPQPTGDMYMAGSPTL